MSGTRVNRAPKGRFPAQGSTLEDPSDLRDVLTAAPLPTAFYDRDPRIVAQELLGCMLCRRLSHGKVLVVRITETEAYLAEGDTANHAHKGMTRRNRSMFGPPGRAYVYAIHTHHCLNLVTEPEGTASAVLIRAAEPLHGLEEMYRNRRTRNPLLVATGPGRLCQAMQIDKSLDGAEVTRRERLWVCRLSAPENLRFAITPRIGVTSAQELPLRFVLLETDFVSRKLKVRRGR